MKTTSDPVWTRPESANGIDVGPCISADAVPILCACEGFVDTLRRQHSSVIPEQRNEATGAVLRWVNTTPRGDHCTRLLLRAKDILWDDPLDSFLEDENYWKICGTVLGELASRKEEARAGVDSGRIFEQIRDRFRPRGAQAWRVRRHVVECLSEFVRRCTRSVAAPADPHHAAFYDTVNHCIAHFEATLDCLDRGQDFGVPDDVALAADRLADLWYQLNQNLGSRASTPATEAGVALDVQTQRMMVVLGGRILAIVRRTNAADSEALRRWQEGLLSLADRIGKKPTDEVAELLGAIIRSMNTEAGRLAAAGDKEYPVFAAIRNCVISALQHRGARVPRQNADCTCTLELVGPSTGTLQLSGRIINICRLSHRGLAVEVDGLLVRQVWEKEAGLREDRRIDNTWECRRIQAFLREDGPAITVEAVNVFVEVDGITQRLPCMISRAWPTPDRDTACGLALRANEADCALSPAWMSWVDGLPNQR